MSDDPDLEREALYLGAGAWLESKNGEWRREVLPDGSIRYTVRAEGTTRMATAPHDGDEARRDTFTAAVTELRAATLAPTGTGGE